MNECDKLFGRNSSVLFRFNELAHRACLEEAEKRKIPNLFDFNHFPKPRVSVESLEKSVKNGLPLFLAQYIYDHAIEMPVKNWFCELRKTRGLSDSLLAQVRAKSRGEELQSKSEAQIKREALSWVNDRWSAAVEHQAVMSLDTAN